MAVGDIVDELARGADVDALGRMFPMLSSEDIAAALEYAAVRLGKRETPRPALSVIVVVHSMIAQAQRTLLSLSTTYQRDVRDSDYEVVVVENESSALLGEVAATQYGSNFRYLRRAETRRSPVWAANEGAHVAVADMLALCIDGARLVTPGVVRATLDATKLDGDVVVSVPGYHLGSEIQQEAVDDGYDEAVEAELLARIGWPRAGYELFDVACPSGSCRGGPLRPMAESNFLAMPKAVFDALGGYDTRFDEMGGGYCNLDLYTRVVEREATRLVVLAGEGTFHQYHGGVSTGGVRGEERRVLMERARAQYEMIRQRPWALPDAMGQVFGYLPPQCLRFLKAPEPDAPDRQSAREAGTRELRSA